MRIGCIYIPNMPVQLALANNTDVAGPLIVGGLPFDAGTVLDASPEAVACGVKPGTALREAHSLCPEATFLPSNELVCEEVFEVIFEMLENFSPVVEIEALGCAYIDVTGVPSERDLLHKLFSDIRSATRLVSCAGVSTGKFFAWAAALTSQPEVPAILAVNTENESIAAFSIEFLPCLSETKERLHLLGIRFIGQLAEFPRDALIAQFGAEGERLHQLATGHDPSVLVPKRKPDTAVDTLDLCPPLESSVELANACEAILNRILPKITSQGKLCDELCVRLRFESCPSQTRKLPLREATASQTALRKRLEAWLEEVTFPAPVNGLELSLRLISDRGKKLALWHDFREGRRLNRVARELRARFGYQPLKKVEVVDQGAILPERRSKLVEVIEQRLEP